VRVLGGIPLGDSCSGARRPQRSTILSFEPHKPQGRKETHLYKTQPIGYWIKNVFPNKDGSLDVILEFRNVQYKSTGFTQMHDRYKIGVVSDEKEAVLSLATYGDMPPISDVMKIKDFQDTKNPKDFCVGGS